MGDLVAVAPPARSHRRRAGRRPRRRPRTVRTRPAPTRTPRGPRSPAYRRCSAPGPGSTRGRIRTSRSSEWRSTGAGRPRRRHCPPTPRTTRRRASTSVSCAAVGVVRGSRLLQRYHRWLFAARPDRDACGRLMVPPRCAGPANATERVQNETLLQSVDCTTAQACVAVGDYNGSSVDNVEFGLIDTLSGGAWSNRPRRNPARRPRCSRCLSPRCPARSSAPVRPRAATKSRVHFPFPTSTPFLLQVGGRCVVGRRCAPAAGGGHGRHCVQPAVGRLVRRAV